ncbi:MAG: hypothetical protein M1819_000241 [Sarea resinae]|nr:MAG: hypothetical protein M1819_000241 [Sarea resinae]
MSHRQKSFFDQDPNPANRPRWYRNRPSGDNPNGNAIHSRPPAVVPIAPSARTKSKLEAFKFADSAVPPPMDATPHQPNEADKENVAIATESALQESEGSQHQALKPSQNSQPKLPRECPKTPASRLALADLLGGSEDTIAHAVLKDTTTPDERVCWAHVRSPRSSGQTSSLTPGYIARRKRRARSSSPLSSSQPEIGDASVTQDESFNLQNLQSMLKTPQADPAKELWSRYTIKTGSNESANLPPMPSFAHLLTEPSPHASVKSGAGSSAVGLRRSMSCGTEWPASAAKRRRIKGPDFSIHGDDIFTDPKSDHQGSGSSKLSRVNALMDKIQESLTKRPSADDAAKDLSSSSPIPDKSDSPQELSDSPLQNRGQANDSEKMAEALAGQDEENPHMRGSDDGSSEFADDIDIDMFESAAMAAEASSHNEPPAAAANHTGTTVAAASVTVAEAFPDTAKAAGARNPQHQVDTDLMQDDFDEFDVDGDELFAADLEHVASKYDALNAAKAMTTAPPCRSSDMLSAEGSAVNTKEPKHAAFGHSEEKHKANPSSDDEFDDDIGLEDFTTAEAIETVVQGGVTPPYEENCDPSDDYVLLVSDERTKLSKTVMLRESWYESRCTIGSYIHVIGGFNRGHCVIDDAHNMLILHPDHLISATVVADSFGCTRRAVLQDRVKATSEATAPQLYGHVLHEIFQEAMKANRWDSAWLQQTIERILPKHLESLYEIKLSIADAIEHLRSKMPELQGWAKLFVSARPNANALVKDRNGQQVAMSINKLLDVEEHVWSPKYGLKGNIDATVQISVDDLDGLKTLTVPFEVKTGRSISNAQHRAQTALYTLLLSDRYDVEITYGILFYMEDSDTSRIPAIRHEIRHMIIQRNELACYIRDRLQLPPMLKSSHLCGRCYAQLPCFIYHKMLDDGDGETSGMKEKFDEVVQHLKPAHQEFFRKWDDLLTKEEKDMLRFRRELWTMLSSEREKVGRCFANVVIKPKSFQTSQGDQKINRFQYTFMKQSPAAGFSFTESQITVGEPIVVSDEKGHFALANGYVTHVRRRQITVAVDRRLHNARVKRPGFSAETNQVFAGIMEVFEDGTPPSTVTEEEMQEQEVYRLDKDEFSNGMATVRNNLIQVMAADVYRAREIRSLVIEGAAPTFKAQSTGYSLNSSASQNNINSDQKLAIEKVMSAKDYALVLGMPGTGKTTTIAHIIRALVSQGKSVLLTSYTHTAVDNILLKIRDLGVGILRLGAVAKIHPEIEEFAILGSAPKQSIEELEQTYHAPQVVATTCLGVNHPIFNQRIFDFCIVDEASQITLPVCLGPIRMAKTFILVGDHFQLPPLVQNEEAREGGLDISLFKLLSERHPQAVVHLEHQYRMCDDIMTLSNELIYSHRLKCGNDAVATRSLHVPHMENLKLHHHHHISLLGSTPTVAGSRNNYSSSPTSVCPGPTRTACWLRDLLDPSTRVSFVNTDALLPGSLESAKGARIVNQAEAALATQLVSALLSTGVPATSIGVITLYRSQLALLKQSLRSSSSSSQAAGAVSGGVEMHTADRFQGRDKDVVILSLVRSNDGGNVGDLLKDWRRVNVALTRARTKLLILGSRRTMLAGNELLARFVGLVEKRGWVYDLPAGALGGHVWEDGGEGTQVSAGTGVGVAVSPEKEKKKKNEKKRKSLSPSPSSSSSPPNPSRPSKPPKSAPTTTNPTTTTTTKTKAARTHNKPFVPPVLVPVKKAATMSAERILGSRPVLRDLVNDAS